MTPHTLSTIEKLALFRRFFTGLKDVYGTYDPASGQVRQVKGPVTDRVMIDHLRGIQPYGVYLLAGDRTRAVVADFDREDLNPPIDFVKAARHYGMSAYIERSKSKGYHVWVFFPESGVPARKARRVVQHILSEIQHPLTEVFPKQDCLSTAVTYGNFINAPLFGKLVPKGRTVFLDTGNPNGQIPNQWDVLRSVQPVPEALLNQIIEANDLEEATPSGTLLTYPVSDSSERAFGLPPCAQQMLAEGVSEHQRVSCFRLGLHLKRAGVPQDIAVAALNGWAQKNKPPAEKRIITTAEIIAQVESAYGRDYRGCGCEEPAIARYCHPSCPLWQKHRSPSHRDPGAEGCEPASTSAEGGRHGHRSNERYCSRCEGLGHNAGGFFATHPPARFCR